jgi:hypothetical protein
MHGPVCLRRLVTCSHQSLPFIPAPAKAKVAGGIETQPGRHLAALTAFRVLDVPIMTAQNKDVRREPGRVRLSWRKLELNGTYRRSKSFHRVLKACRSRNCSLKHINCWALILRLNEPGSEKRWVEQHMMTDEFENLPPEEKEHFGTQNVVISLIGEPSESAATTS